MSVCLSAAVSMFKVLLAIEIFVFSSILLVDASPSQSHFSKFTRSSGGLSHKDATSSVCKHTPHPAICESSLLSSSSKRGTDDPPEALVGVFFQSVHSTVAKAQYARALAYNLTVSHRQNADNFLHSPTGGMHDCLELLDDAIDMLDNVMTTSLSKLSDDDVHTWLSAALTNQETCLESLEKDKFKTDKNIMDATAQNLSQYISNSLALFVLTTGANSNSGSFATGSEHLPRHEESKSNEAKSANPNRKLLASDSSFPTWVPATERKLLEASVGEIEADAVVAQDGSGTHKSIGEALKALQLIGTLESSGTGGRSVIHVSAGTYHEYINIPTKQKNVMLIGDGVGKTIIVGNRNSDDGWTTYKTATVAAMGDGFIARDITFVNNAGPSKHQAVALRVGADKSVVHRCSIMGYQDTLYTHSKRQFYRETDIYGTVDFIFGNSAVVFQSCNIYPRKPTSSGLKNFVTAQGRSSPDQNTGISIHNCKISAASDLAPVRSSYQTYLGRPWKQYSRTIVMQSILDDSIHRSGWSPWSGGFALNTLYYGEYMNSGSGASTSGRVQWGGYHSSLTSTQAQAFTVAGFISGNLWLPSTGVSFSSGLIG
ncbi:probable pectinesterase/pectinesterase inhibitor 16 [Argentina anserina]|uniref:probable pectinesterase/pectinesterase inhibitor 16 n=1 Tax=Argentina anserina TaxID=57926 RepID=UPI00217667D0|nr:probable pectinesterase/pectinesterase inhibitor 16 [Potentilla anserina]